MICTGYFSLSTGIPQDKQNHHTWGIYLYSYVQACGQNFLKLTWCWFSALLWWVCLCLTTGFLFLCFPGGSSVCWYHMRLTCTVSGSPATCLMCLAVALELPIFLASWCTLLAANFSRSTPPSLIVLDTNSSSHRKNWNISQCKILAVSGGYLARLIWACTALYHSSTLLLACLKLVTRSNWALTLLDWSLQNYSNLSHIVSRLNSSLDKHHETYWSIPKSLLQAMTFLHFCFSGRATSSHSSIFSHFQSLLKESVVEPIIYCPIHLWTFYIWHEHAWNHLLHWVCRMCQRQMEWDLWILF